MSLVDSFVGFNGLGLYTEQNGAPRNGSLRYINYIGEARGISEVSFLESSRVWGSSMVFPRITVHSWGCRKTTVAIYAQKVLIGLILKILHHQRHLIPWKYGFTAYRSVPPF